jgi:hypothetical protein
MSAPNTASGRRLDDKVNGVPKTNGVAHAKRNGAATKTPEPRQAKRKPEPLLPLFETPARKPARRAAKKGARSRTKVR